jgi:hypothetical protein
MIYCVDVFEQSDGSCDIDQTYYFSSKEEALAHFTPGVTEINDDDYWSYSCVSDPYPMSDRTKQDIAG